MEEIQHHTDGQGAQKGRSKADRGVNHRGCSPETGRRTRRWREALAPPYTGPGRAKRGDRSTGLAGAHLPSTEERRHQVLGAEVLDGLDLVLD